MKKTQSLQWRLSLWLTAGVTVFWIIAAVLTGLNIRAEIDEVFDGALEETAQRILPLAINDILEREEQGQTERIDDIGKHDELLTYVVRDANGFVLISSHDAILSDFPPFSDETYETTATHQVYFSSALDGQITIAVADPLSHRREAFLESVRALLSPLLFLLPIILISVLLLVRLTMRPVRAFTKEIEARNVGDLTLVGAADLPLEIAPIADAVNNLLERLRRALEAERSFTANSAHELRTPVAAALAQAQRMIAEARDDPTKDRATQIEAALIRLASLSEKLMQLAKSEGAGLVSEQHKDVVPILVMVARDFQQFRGDSGRLQIALPSRPVMSTMDLDAFAILLRNLIENALNHGTDDSDVSVSLSTVGELRVANDCAALDHATLDDLKRPFVRGETSANGTGLGLAIVNAIAAGSNSALTLRSPIKGSARGLEALVVLPK